MRALFSFGVPALFLNSFSLSSVYDVNRIYCHSIICNIKMSTNHRINIARQLKKPNDSSGREFEAMCLLIYQQHYETADAVYYGRGHTQHGIDIRMTTSEGAKPLLVIVQCKDVSRFNFSTFERDLTLALNMWAPKQEHESDVLYIVATTATGINTEDIDSKVDDLLKTKLPKLAGDRFRFLLHDWDWLETVVRSHTSLAEYFLESRDEFIETKSHGLTRAGEQIAAAIAKNQLKAAQKVWDDYLSEDRHPPVKPLYAHIPIWICEHLCDMFLKAGDFEKAARLFDSALGRREFSAKFRVGYLRAKRVVSRIPDDNISFDAMFRRSASFDIAQEVEDTAKKLVSSLGTLDEQLLLALWVLTYAKSAEVGNLGLTRALSLINQAWPRGVEGLALGRSYKVTTGRLRAVSAEQKIFEGQHADERNQYAIVLAYAYSYCRMLHSERYGYSTTLDVEKTAGGWTLEIYDLGIGNLDDFFCHLPQGVKKRLETLLPAFYKEGSNREFCWENPVGIHALGAPDVPYSGANCTSNLLLADCVSNTVKLRLDTLPLFTTHLALERILQVLCLCEIDEEVLTKQINSPDHLLRKRRMVLSSLVSRITRAEWRSPRERDQIYAFTTYYNFQNDIKLDEFTVTLEFTRQTRRALIVTTNLEATIACGTNEKITILPYWEVHS